MRVTTVCHHPSTIPRVRSSLLRHSVVPRAYDSFDDMAIVSVTTATAAAGVLILVIAAGAAAAAGARRHHVVGGDPGWAVASDVLAWSADRLFTVGDTLCKSMTNACVDLCSVFSFRELAVVVRVRVLGGGRRRRGGRRRGGVRVVRRREPRQDVHGGAQPRRPRRRRVEVLRQRRPGQVRRRAEAARRRAGAGGWYDATARVVEEGRPSCRSGARAVGVQRRPRSRHVADVRYAVLPPVPGHMNMEQWSTVCFV